MMLLRSIKGFGNSRTLVWLACVPLALFGLGVFNLAAHAAELPELTPAFLANNLLLLILVDLRRLGDLHERRLCNGGSRHVSFQECRQHSG